MNAYTKEQYTAKQMTVSHHGLNGIGNKKMSNHMRHDKPLREEMGHYRPSLPEIPLSSPPELIASTITHSY